MANEVLHLPSGPVEGAPVSRTKSKRQFVNNAAPSQRRAGGRPPKDGAGSGQERRPRRGKATFIHGPVKIDTEVLAAFAALTRYAPKRDAHVRYAMANVIFTIAEGKAWPKEKLWDALGRWNSALRGIKTLEEITNRHHGWQAVQRIRVALARAKNDPMHTTRIQQPMHQFIAEALLALDTGLERHFQAHPELLMTGEEVAGMAPLLPAAHFKDPLFQKPPSISPVPPNPSGSSVSDPDATSTAAGETKPNSVATQSEAAGMQEPTSPGTRPSLAKAVAQKLRAIVGL